jgi:hypothetical protein
MRDSSGNPFVPGFGTKDCNEPDPLFLRGHAHKKTLIQNEIRFL